MPALPAQSFAFRGPMWPEPFEVHARVQGTELGTCLRVLVRNAPGKEVAHRVDGAGPSDGGRGCVRTDLAGREHIVVHAKRNAAAGRSFANAQKPRRPVEHVDQIEPFGSNGGADVFQVAFGGRSGQAQVPHALPHFVYGQVFILRADDRRLVYSTQVRQDAGYMGLDGSALYRRHGRQLGANEGKTHATRLPPAHRTTALDGAILRQARPGVRTPGALWLWQCPPTSRACRRAGFRPKT